MQLVHLQLVIPHDYSLMYSYEVTKVLITQMRLIYRFAPYMNDRSYLKSIHVYKYITKELNAYKYRFLLLKQGVFIVCILSMVRYI